MICPTELTLLKVIFITLWLLLIHILHVQSWTATGVVIQISLWGSIKVWFVNSCHVAQASSCDCWVTIILRRECIVISQNLFLALLQIYIQYCLNGESSHSLHTFRPVPLFLCAPMYTNQTHTCLACMFAQTCVHTWSELSGFYISTGHIKHTSDSFRLLTCMRVFHSAANESLVHGHANAWHMMNANKLI